MQTLSVDEILTLPTTFKHNRGVYFLIDRNTVAYVGQSRNIANRINSHKSANRIKYDRCVSIPLPDDGLLPAERAYIKALAPTYNRKVGGKRDGSGRPSEDPTVFFHFRVTVGERDEMKRRALARNMSVTDMIKLAVLSGKE